MELCPGYQWMGIRKDLQRRWCWSWVFKEVFGKRLRLPVRKKCFPCPGGMRGGEDEYAVMPLLWWLRVWGVEGGLAKTNCHTRDWTGLCVDSEESWEGWEKKHDMSKCVCSEIYLLLWGGEAYRSVWYQESRNKNCGLCYIVQYGSSSHMCPYKLN